MVFVPAGAKPFTSPPGKFFAIRSLVLDGAEFDELDFCVCGKSRDETTLVPTDCSMDASLAPLTLTLVSATNPFRLALIL